MFISFSAILSHLLTPLKLHQDRNDSSVPMPQYKKGHYITQLHLDKLEKKLNEIRSRCPPMSTTHEKNTREFTSKMPLIPDDLTQVYFNQHLAEDSDPENSEANDGSEEKSVEDHGVENQAKDQDQAEDQEGDHHIIYADEPGAEAVELNSNEVDVHEPGADALLLDSNAVDAEEPETSVDGVTPDLDEDQMSEFVVRVSITFAKKSTDAVPTQHTLISVE